MSSAGRWLASVFAAPGTGCQVFSKQAGLLLDWEILSYVELKPTSPVPLLTAPGAAGQNSRSARVTGSPLEPLVGQETATARAAHLWGQGRPWELSRSEVLRGEWCTQWACRGCVVGV